MIVLQRLDIQEGNGTGVEMPSINELLEIGKGRIVQRGKKAAILKFWNKIRRV